MWLPPPPAKPAPSRSGKFPGLTTLEILSLHAAPLPPASAPSILICAMLLPGTCLVFPLSCPQEDLPTGIRSLGLFPVWEDSHLTSFLGSFHWKTLNLTAKLWTSVLPHVSLTSVTPGCSSPPLAFRRFSRHDTGHQLQCLSKSRTCVSVSKRALGNFHS